MLDELNKKREKICKKSQILTFIIVAITVICVALTVKHFLFGLLGGFLLIISLYYLSKKYVIPEYNKVKSEIINSTFKNNTTTTYIESFKSPLDIFFDIINMSYTNPLNINYNNLNFKVEDFLITEGNKKGAKVLFKGKILELEIENLFTKDVLALPSFFHEFKNFEETVYDHFKNAEFNLNYTFKGKYLTNTKEKEDLLKIATIFNEIENFHIILYKNNKLSIMIKERENPFECELQKEITNKTIDTAKRSYKEIKKIIEYFINEK